jgi:hypothetical protein
MAQACNPSHSGGRDWEDCISSPALAKSSKDPISATAGYQTAGTCLPSSES